MSANPAERNLKAKERIPNLIAAAVLGVSLYSSPDLQGSSTNIEQPPPPVPITNPSPSETSIPKNQIIENPSVNQALEAIQNYYSGLDTEKIFNNKESIKGPFVELRIPEINVEDGKSELFYPKEINSYGLIIDSDGKSNLILIPPSIQIGGQEFNAKLVNEPKSSTYKITYTNSSGVSVDLDLEKTVISGQPVIQSPKDTIIISTTGESNGWIAKLSTNIGGNNNETINASYFIDDNKINIIINGYQINLPLEELSKYINFEDESNGKLEVILDNQEPNIAVLYHNDKYFGEINLSDGSFIIELNQSYITSKNIMNIRKGPSTSESKIGQLTPDNFKQIKYLETVDDKGTKIDPNDPNNDNYWHKVDLGNGQIGYIAGKLNGQEYSILQQETQNLKINPDNNIILLPKPDFEKNEIKSSIGNFVNALNKAGIRITPEQVTQGLTYQTIEVPKKDPKTGEVIKDEAGNEIKETVVFGVYNLPPEVFPPEYQELAGEYPILMWQKEKGWFILTARELAGIKRVNIGNLESHYDRVAKNPDLTRKFFNTFNTWLITWYQKWDLVEPKQKEYNYSALDKYLTLANKNNIRPLGGPLVYFYEYPKWLTNSSLSKDKIEEALKSHVFETVLRYKDMINFWIVVNEYHNTPAEPDFLNNILSQNYVEIAFKEARRANPNAILIYNDNTIESQKGRWFNQTYNLVRKLKDQGIIDGVGMQMHLNQPNWTGVPTNEELREAIAKFRELGLEVYITEMDIVEKGTRPNLNQARDYYNVIITYLNSTKGQKMQLISFFGFTDAHSWYDEVLHNPDANPLLFDDLGKPKLSYYAFIKALFEYSIRD